MNCAISRGIPTRGRGLLLKSNTDRRPETPFAPLFIQVWHSQYDFAPTHMRFSHRDLVKNKMAAFLENCALYDEKILFFRSHWEHYL